MCSKQAYLVVHRVPVGVGIRFTGFNRLLRFDISWRNPLHTISACLSGRQASPSWAQNKFLMAELVPVVLQGSCCLRFVQNHNPCSSIDVQALQMPTNVTAIVGAVGAQGTLKLLEFLGVYLMMVFLSFLFRFLNWHFGDSDVSTNIFWC